MSDEVDRASRERIHAAIQAEIDYAFSSRVEVEDAVLTGWVIIAEWMDSNSGRWLTTTRSLESTDWQARGYANEFLNHWPEVED